MLFRTASIVLTPPLFLAAGISTAQPVGTIPGGSAVFGYTNDGARELESVSWPAAYSAGFSAKAFPGGTVTLGRDAAGNIALIADRSGTRALGHEKNRLTSTDWLSGKLNPYKVVRAHDAGGRLVGVTVYRNGTPIHSVGYVHTGASDEIAGVGASGFSAGYSRNAGRHPTGVTRGGVAQSWGRGAAGRVTSAGSNVAGAPSFAYTGFDAKGRREMVATNWGTWSYAYRGGLNGDGQLASASNPQLGAFAYGTDGIGRRVDFAGNGGDALNRFVAMSHPQVAKTLYVTADPAARVWVNGVELNAAPDDFDGFAAVAVGHPGAAGGWVPWLVKGVIENGGHPGAFPDAVSELAGHVWFPPQQESFTYDVDGNRESSALWDYGWDGGNRLVRAATRDRLSAPEGWDVEFDYDAEGRRFKKEVTRYEDGQPVERKTVWFIWDGWDLAYERHEDGFGNLLLERKYVWGADVSGSHMGAGGAGGLLLMRERRGHGGTEKDYYPLFDGSGHVVALADSTGSKVAEYWYGPFGELISATGELADANPWRYATKYFDSETGLYYFGRRYFDPVTGQWLNREPLGESESLNLYAYCHNDPVNNVDRLGLESVPMYQNQIAEALARLRGAPGEHGSKGSAIDGQWEQWMEMFAGLEALASKGDPKALHQLRLLRDVHQGSHAMNDLWLDVTMNWAQARIDVANAGINRIYKQTAFLEWTAGMEPGHLDPAADPSYFDDDNPEFQSDEWSRRWIQFNPGGKIAREAVNGNYGAMSYEFGKEVAIWSTMGIAGEFVGTGRVAFGVTSGGMGGGLNDLGVRSYLRFTQGSRWHSYYDSFLPGTARLRFSISGRNGLWRGAASEGSATFGQFASLQRPWSPFHSKIGNALNGVTDNAASRLWSVSTRPGFYVEGIVAPQGVFPGGYTQIFKANGNVLSRPLFGNRTPWSLLNETGY